MDKQKFGNILLWYLGIYVFYIYTRWKILKLVNIFKLSLRLFNTILLLILREFCSELFQVTALLLWSLLKSSSFPEISVIAQWSSYWKTADLRGSYWSFYWEYWSLRGFPPSAKDQAVKQVLYLLGHSFIGFHNVPWFEWVAASTCSGC